MVKGNKFKPAGVRDAPSAADNSTPANGLAPPKTGNAALSGAQRKKKAKFSADAAARGAAVPLTSKAVARKPSAATIAAVPAAYPSAGAEYADAAPVSVGKKGSKPVVSGAARKRLAKEKRAAAAIASGGSAMLPPPGGAKRLKLSPVASASTSDLSASSGSNRPVVPLSAAAESNARKKARAAAKRLERRKLKKAAAAATAAAAAASNAKGTPILQPGIAVLNGKTGQAEQVTAATQAAAETAARPALAAASVDSPDARASNSGAVLATAASAPAAAAGASSAATVLRTGVGEASQPPAGAIACCAETSAAKRGAQTNAQFAAAAGVEGIGSVGGNWAALKAQLSVVPKRFRQHRKRQLLAAEAAEAAAEVAATPREARATAPVALNADAGVTPIVAVDCEMVGVGPDGARSELARVCIVNNHGVVLMDKFARPKERVTDFRTRFSGIRPANIRAAPEFVDVQREAAELLKGRTIVGHSIANDLKALLLGHPGKLVRDTARFPPLMLPRRPGGKARARSLRELAAEQLGLAIQEGEHSPVDDARASLYLYHKYKQEWEKELKEYGTTRRLKSQLAGTGRRGAVRSLADLARKDSMVDL